MQNPLLNSCECHGSVRFVHFFCLKQWLSSQMVRSESSSDQGQVISYCWRKFECDLCKHPYPYSFMARGLTYKLTDIIHEDIPRDRPYLLLESMGCEKEASRNIHVVIPERTIADDHQPKVFKLGRGHNCPIRISDISVSRCHTLLKFDPATQAFSLEDNLSKFGTLITQQHHQMTLCPDRTTAI